MPKSAMYDSLRGYPYVYSYAASGVSKKFSSEQGICAGNTKFTKKGVCLKGSGCRIGIYLARRRVIHGRVGAVEEDMIVTTDSDREQDTCTFSKPWIHFFRSDRRHAKHAVCQVAQLKDGLGDALRI